MPWVCIIRKYGSQSKTFFSVFKASRGAVHMVLPFAGHIEGVSAENGPPLHGAASLSPSGFSPPKIPTEA